MKQQSLLKKSEKLLPWVAGAGFAVSHIVASTNCSIPKEGRCSTCGGCVVALAAIVTWAVHKKKQGSTFYDDRSARF